MRMTHKWQLFFSTFENNSLTIVEHWSKRFKEQKVNLFRKMDALCFFYGLWPAKLKENRGHCNEAGVQLLWLHPRSLETNGIKLHSLSMKSHSHVTTFAVTYDYAYIATLQEKAQKVKSSFKLWIYPFNKHPQQSSSATTHVKKNQECPN